MESPYANRVETYGRRWHRPWLALLAVLIVAWGFHWLPREKRVGTALAPPDTCEDRAGSRFRPRLRIDGLDWTADVGVALACASRQRRRILLAFHAVTDTNARFNERNVLRDQRVKAALRGYVLLVLYTDLVPELFYRMRPGREDQARDAQANLTFQRDRFLTEQEPLYVVLQPRGMEDFEVVAWYNEGRIAGVKGFVRFLQNPLSASQEAR